MKDFWKVLNEYHAAEMKQREALCEVLTNVVLKKLKGVETEMMEEKKMVRLVCELLTFKITMELNKLERGLELQYNNLTKVTAGPPCCHTDTQRKRRKLSIYHKKSSMTNLPQKRVQSKLRTLQR